MYSLFAAQVAFRRLDRNMTQKELDLFQLSSRGVAEAGAGAALTPHAALPTLCRIPDNAELKSQALVILGDPSSQG
jgi:hypothetical protein